MGRSALAAFAGGSATAGFAGLSPNNETHSQRKKPSRGGGATTMGKTGGGGGADGAGSVGRMAATAASGVAGRLGCRAVTSGGSGAAGILYEAWLFSGAADSSPRMRRIS